MINFFECRACRRTTFHGMTMWSSFARVRHHAVNCEHFKMMLQSVGGRVQRFWSDRSTDKYGGRRIGVPKLQLANLTRLTTLNLVGYSTHNLVSGALPCNRCIQVFMLPWHAIGAAGFS